MTHLSARPAFAAEVASPARSERAETREVASPALFAERSTTDLPYGRARDPKREILGTAHFAPHAIEGARLLSHIPHCTWQSAKVAHSRANGLRDSTPQAAGGDGNVGEVAAERYLPRLSFVARWGASLERRSEAHCSSRPR